MTVSKLQNRIQKNIVLPNKIWGTAGNVIWKCMQTARTLRHTRNARYSGCCARAGLPSGPGADAAIGTDKVAVLHGDSACAGNHCEGRGRSGVVQGPGRDAATSDAQPGHQLHRLWHPPLPLAASAWRCLPHGACHLLTYMCLFSSGHNISFCLATAWPPREIPVGGHCSS